MNENDLASISSTVSTRRKFLAATEIVAVRGSGTSALTQARQKLIVLAQEFPFQSGRESCNEVIRST